MNITKPTHIKIILRKIKPKKLKVPIGFVVTKANAPTIPPESTLVGKGKTLSIGQTSLPLNNRTYAERLNEMEFKKEKGSDNIPEFELPRLSDKLERKLQILDNEWYIQTSYSSCDDAALYGFFKPTQGPFVIVPSLIKDDAKNVDFTMTVFSSHPV